MLFLYRNFNIYVTLSSYMLSNFDKFQLVISNVMHVFRSDLFRSENHRATRPLNESSLVVGYSI